MDISLDFPAENKLENISKTKISTDGSFELTGNIKELNVYQLTIPNLKKLFHYLYCPVIKLP